LRLLHDLKEKALTGSQLVFLDLSNCVYIDPVACVMLTAEVERCNGIRPNRIVGRNSPSPLAQFVLGTMGFYRHLRWGSPPSLKPRHLLEIQTGGLPTEGETRNPGQQVYSVASLAQEVFGDEQFADNVHGALNEATDNVISWAYDPEFVEPAETLRRWWVAGVGNPEEHRATFFAYDQGAGIPKTAPKNLGERFKDALGVILAKARIVAAQTKDHHILEATINERRTRSGIEGRGKGLGRMIELIEGVDRGEIFIFSGAARYGFIRGADGEPIEGSSALPATFPGTLVVWSLTAAKVGGGS
jgi:hypothetical protein